MTIDLSLFLSGHNPRAEDEPRAGSSLLVPLQSAHGVMTGDTRHTLARYYCSLSLIHYSSRRSAEIILSLSLSLEIYIISSRDRVRHKLPRDFFFFFWRLLSRWKEAGHPFAGHTLRIRYARARYKCNGRARLYARVFTREIEGDDRLQRPAVYIYTGVFKVSAVGCS